MKDGNYFDLDVPKPDFFAVKLSSEFRNYLSSLTPEKESVGVLDYDRNYGDIHILIEVMEDVYAIYLKDYNFGHIKPLGECIYEVKCKNNVSNYERNLYAVVLPDLIKKISDGEIDMDKVALRDGAGFTPSTLSKLSNNKPVSMNILAKICEFLECNIGDIVDYIPSKPSKK